MCANTCVKYTCKNEYIHKAILVGYIHFSCYKHLCERLFLKKPWTSSAQINRVILLCSLANNIRNILKPCRVMRFCITSKIQLFE